MSYPNHQPMVNLAWLINPDRVTLALADLDGYEQPKLVVKTGPVTSTEFEVNFDSFEGADGE